MATQPYKGNREEQRMSRPTKGRISLPDWPMLEWFWGFPLVQLRRQVQRVRARRNAQQASPSSIPNVPVWAGKTTNSGPDLDGKLGKEGESKGMNPQAYK